LAPPGASAHSVPFSDRGRVAPPNPLAPILRYGARFAANEATSQFPQKAPYLAELPARRAAETLTLGCPEAMLEIAVARTRRSARAFRATVHPTADPASDGGLAAGLACSGPGAATGCLGHIGQPALDVGLTHGVVCQFLPSASRSPGGLTMPTIPWAPGCMCTCRTSTVCLWPRRCRSRACIRSSCSLSSLLA
jgi:hypothetical protein